MAFESRNYNVKKMAEKLGMSMTDVQKLMKECSFGGYALVWKVEDKGNYSVCQLSCSEKKRDGSGYEATFQNNFVRFVGHAHEKIKSVVLGEREKKNIQIISANVQRNWSREKEKEYINFAVFDFEFVDGAKAETTSQAKVEKSYKPKNVSVNVDEDDLPF